MRLVLASRNKKKLRELVDLLGDLVPDLTDLTPYPEAPEVDETGTTFAENAALKAVQLSRALGTWTVGEDSGLCVPALGGAPGIFSARYAGTHGDDAANNIKLLNELTNQPDRSAYYVSSIALADPSGTVRFASEGRCWGRIVAEYRGQGGFGYDPLFEIPEYHATFGELPAVVKHALSHRGRAVRKLREFLLQLNANRENTILSQ
jgi:XTP/dITP diphosphohydrolase